MQTRAQVTEVSVSCPNFNGIRVRTSPGAADMCARWTTQDLITGSVTLDEEGKDKEMAPETGLDGRPDAAHHLHRGRLGDRAAAAIRRMP